ncbi:MAG TPA: radical SAM protein, partial [Thermodesulfobacteriota bacterium]|nr:radical SAM protein [Thermodesulfobacteriota bacterium]
MPIVTARIDSLEEKLAALADSAKYDVSCASSGSSRKNPNGVGNAALGGICHTWAADGRCISLLKILLTNQCVYDCAYCINRASNSIPRASFAPRELADLTLEFYKRNYIEGLFLSSGIKHSPDHTMELMIRTVEILRREYLFNGYIHLKVLPGVDPALATKAGRLADRVSVNIELPTKESLGLLAPQKIPRAIAQPMRRLSDAIRAAHEERRESP